VTSAVELVLPLGALGAQKAIKDRIGGIRYALGNLRASK